VAQKVRPLQSCGGMQRYRRILVASDYSEPSMTAIRVAAAWAKALDAKLELLHAFLPARYAKEIMPGETDLPAKLKAAALSELKGLRDQCAPEHPDAVLTAVEAERAASAICEHADDPNSDLIVIGTHGRTGLSRMLIGSVAESVVRHAQCDVLAVAPGAEVGVPQQMVTPTDFSPTAERGLAAAEHLGRTFGGHTTLLHVVDASLPALPVGAFADDDLTERKSHAWDALATVRADQFRDRVDVATWVEVDPSPPDAIVRIAAGRKADLIVLATHGRTGLASLLIGSVAERVVRHAACPVLAVRGEGVSDVPAAEIH